MLFVRGLLWLLIVCLASVLRADDIEESFLDVMNGKYDGCNHTQWEDIENQLLQNLNNILNSTCNWLLEEETEEIFRDFMRKLEKRFNNEPDISPTESPITAIPTDLTTTTTTTTTTTPAPTTPPSTTRSTTTTTTVAPIVQCGEVNENRCVAFWKCKSSRTVSDKYEIDITNSEECHYLETCCPDAEIVNNSRTISNSDSSRCGYGTNNGVIMTIKGKTSSESDFGEYPWTVGVFDKDDKYLLGGSLISLKVVLTSASHLNSKHRKVRAGEWDMNTKKEALSYEERFVKETVKHSKFDNNVHANDVALLILEKPFKQFPHIRPICLPRNITLNENECIVTGWNDKRSQKNQSIMRAMKLQLTRCREHINKTLLCVRGNNSDLVYGYGSPLVCPEQGGTNRYYQIGIWSHGMSTNITKFTNVHLQYEWITKLVKENEKN